MAQNKNQHFVPKAHLKPFSVVGGGRAIHLFNLLRDRPIFDAPVRNQCSRDYFYGQDALLEDAIQFVEGSYAGCVADLSGRETVDPGHEAVLKRFMYLQHLRTEAAAKNAADYSAAMARMIENHEQAPSYDEFFKSGVLIAMRHYADTMKIVDDLALCVVKNRTPLPFVTSDDPSIIMNRWHMYRPANRHLAFGVRSAGLLMIMPLSPKMTAVLYDRDIYSLGPAGKMRATRDPRDIAAFNHFQALHCSANLYFGNEADAGYVVAAARGATPRRPARKVEINYAVADKIEGDYQRFSVVKNPDFSAEHDMLVHAATVRPVPAFWPPLLHYRDRRIAYTNGTRAGFARRATVGPDDPIRPWARLKV